MGAKWTIPGGVAANPRASARKKVSEIGEELIVVVISVLKISVSPFAARRGEASSFFPDFSEISKLSKTV